MFTMKSRKLAATLAFAVVGMAIAVPSAQARVIPAQSAASSYLFADGQALAVVYDNSPLRVCPGTSCAIEAYMPATKYIGPGGGWVTSLAFQPADGAWCVIDWKQIDGWTGCWRLAVPA